MWLKIKAIYNLGVLFGSSFSSNNILIGGEASSSNCPDFTLQIKAPKNKAARLILANNIMIMALIQLTIVTNFNN